MKNILFAIALIATPIIPAWASPPDEIVDLIGEWKENIKQCKGAPLAEWDSPKVVEACHNWQTTLVALDTLGWCFGRKSDKATYLHKWHKCRGDSFHAK